MNKAIIGTLLFLATVAGTLAQSTPCITPPASANEPTLAQAAEVCRASTERGDAKSQYVLGNMYFYARGVPQDYTEAVRWYRKAADQGFAKAQYNLGNMYFHGHGVQEDRAEAARWYNKSADRGDEYALRALGGELSDFGKFFLFVQFCVSAWCLHTVFSNKSQPDTGLTYLRKRSYIGTGILGVFYTGLTWYGYSQHKIRSLRYGFDAFNLCRQLLFVVLIALLVYIVRSSKMSGVRRDGMDSV